jgi:hypothetical protein
MGLQMLAIVCSNKASLDVKIFIQDDLDKISNWLVKNKLSNNMR